MDLASRMARRIFKLGSDSHDPVQRIQFKGGTYPDHETDLGGLNEESFAVELREMLKSEQTVAELIEEMKAAHAKLVEAAPNHWPEVRLIVELDFSGDTLVQFSAWNGMSASRGRTLRETIANLKPFDPDAITRKKIEELKRQLAELEAK